MNPVTGEFVAAHVPNTNGRTDQETSKHSSLTEINVSIELPPRKIENGSSSNADTEFFKPHDVILDLKNENKEKLKTISILRSGLSICSTTLLVGSAICIVLPWIAKSTDLAEPTSISFKTQNTSIKSLSDISQVSQDTNVVQILSMIGYTNSISSVSKPNVMQLEILGEISTECLLQMFLIFNNIKTLIIDSDVLNSKSRKNIIGDFIKDKITVPHLTNLHINNLHSVQSLAWGMEVELPALEQLVIKSSDLNDKVFRQLEMILRTSKSTLSTIEVSNSYICNSCELSQDEFPNLSAISYDNLLDKFLNPISV